jgi:hypothetical protein
MTRESKPVDRIRGPGHHVITWNDHTYHVYQFVSEYGDKQWMVDRDDEPAWSQTTTLAQARSTIQVYG